MEDSNYQVKPQTPRAVIVLRHNRLGVCRFEQELDTMTKKELTLEVERLKKLVFGDSNFVGSNDDEMVLLKLRDYTTHIMARVRVDADGFKHYYVMRGDGRCFRYGDFGVEWVKKLSI